MKGRAVILRRGIVKASTLNPPEIITIVLLGQRPIKDVAHRPAAKPTAVGICFDQQNRGRRRQGEILVEITSGDGDGLGQQAIALVFDNQLMLANRQNQAIAPITATGGALGWLRLDIDRRIRHRAATTLHETLHRRLW